LKDRRHSSTALLIAKSTRLAAADPLLSVLVPAGAGEVSDWFIRDHAPDYELASKAWYRAFLMRLSSWVLPGIQLHYAARKALIEAEVLRAIERGAEQVVVVAGGFDTLVYRLHQGHPRVRFFELDHPATQASKRHSLIQHGSIGDNLRLHPVDLTHAQLGQALQAAGVEAGRPSVVVAEGVLMYLGAALVEAFISSLDAYFSGRLALALTFMQPDTRGRRRFHNGSWLLGAWLWFEGEPFRSAFEHESLLALLARHHFPHAELWDHTRLRQSLLPPALRQRPIAIGEHVCITER
jgi:methyltransferase (TIGR00027 family)